MFVSDLRHFLDLPPDVPTPARRIAEQLSLLVRAATAGDAGSWWVSALGCTRRPGRKPCPGHMALFRPDIGPQIAWRCTSCRDEGLISGWEGTPFDVRPTRNERGRAEVVRVVVDDAVASDLRGLLLLDSAVERLVFRASIDGDEVVLVGDNETIEELVDAVIAEANHEADRRRRKRLDSAADRLSEAVASARRR